MILFGTTEREALRGEVADYCSVCRRIRRFAVIDHRRALHLYFVPLGKGRYQGTTRRCVECGHYHEFDADRYADVLPHSEAEALDLEQVLRRTTPDVAERFEAIDAIERVAQKSPYRGGTDEPSEGRLEEAAAALRRLELQGIDSSRFCKRFARWERLGESERQNLLAELRGYVAALEDTRGRAP